MILINPLSAVLENAKAFEQRILNIVGECMLEHKEEITALLVYQQQSEHKDSAGNPLRAYSLPYRKHKELSGKSGETDLDLTGQFQGGMNLSVTDDQFTFESPAQTDQGELKSEWLNRWNEERGGSDVMRLTDEKKPEVWAIIVDTFRLKTRDLLLG